MFADAEFTPNADRAIWIDGEINKALETRLRPKILALTSSSREPITVFLDSDGGTAAVGSRILELLRSTNPDHPQPCRLITVALSKAKSAAADILSAGDFAIADPGSKLLYHGTRITTSHAVTADHASLLADFLKISNRSFAMSFLDRSAQRFLFLIAALRPTFEAHRANAAGRTLTDLGCFQEILYQKTSPAAQRVLRQAATIWDRRHGLIARFQDEAAKLRLSDRADDIEQIMFDASVAFERERNKTDPEWSLRTGGLRAINDHFFFLTEYFQFASAIPFAPLSERWASSILAKEELESLSADEKAERFQSFFLPFWSFFVALYNALQQAENELTAMDAFWLGLIDTLSDGTTAQREQYKAECFEERGGTKW